MGLFIDYQNSCRCNWLNKLLGGCWCNTTDICGDCGVNEGRVIGYGSHSDLPFYSCYECSPLRKKIKGKTLREQQDNK